MEIDKDIINQVASKSNLYLTDKEKEKIRPEIEEVLKAFSKINELDTKNVERSLHPVIIEGETRGDEEGNSLSNEQALSLTTHKKDKYFRGPKI